jgi:transcriptional regulator of acetoin/glycerol metabolism
MNSTDTRKQAMLHALEKTLGVVTSAARQVGIERTTHYNWMKEVKTLHLTSLKVNCTR